MLSACYSMFHSKMWNKISTCFIWYQHVKHLGWCMKDIKDFDRALIQVVGINVQSNNLSREFKKNWPSKKQRSSFVIQYCRWLNINTCARHILPFLYQKNVWMYSVYYFEMQICYKNYHMQTNAKWRGMGKKDVKNHGTNCSILNILILWCNMLTHYIDFLM